MKKFLSVSLVFALILSLTMPAHAAYEGEPGDIGEYIPATSVPANVINLICERIDEKKGEFGQTQILEEGTPEVDDKRIVELATQLAELREEKEATGLSATLWQSAEIVDKETQLEGALAELNTALLSDEDLEKIFSGTSFSIHGGQEAEGISPASVIDYPSLSTNYSNWTLTKSGSSGCYITAWPKNSMSTLWSTRNDFEINHPILSSDLFTIVIEVVGFINGIKHKIADIVLDISEAAADKAKDGYTAAFNVTEKLTVKLAYVYDSSRDEYVNTLITHSDALSYRYIANVLQMDKGGSCGTADGLYFRTSDMLQRANSNFNSNPYRTELDHMKYYDIKVYHNGITIDVGRITPIYITSGSQVN